MVEKQGRNRSALALAVAAQVRAERAAAGMTQQQVMDRSGLPKSTYLRMESGERVADVSQLAAFCAAVGVSMADLMRRAEERVAASEAPAATLSEHVTRQLSPEAQEQVRIAKAEVTKRTRRAQPNG